MAKSSVWETLENCNLRKFKFLKTVIILRCPKCIQGKFKTYLKNFEMCFIFSSLLGHFVKEFWMFLSKNHPKMPQSGVVWKTLKKTKFWEKLIFLTSAVVLGCTEWILEEFITSLKILIFFLYFRHFFGILCKILDFEVKD